MLRPTATDVARFLGTRHTGVHRVACRTRLTDRELVWAWASAYSGKWGGYPSLEKLIKKLKSESMQKSSFPCLCYILRAIRAGRCRKRRYAEHIFIHIGLYSIMHHFVVKFSTFSSPQAARGHWPPNQNPADVPGFGGPGNMWTWALPFAATLWMRWVDLCDSSDAAYGYHFCSNLLVLPITLFSGECIFFLLCLRRGGGRGLSDTAIRPSHSHGAAA